MAKTRTLLIAGLGNILNRDDGFGIEVAARLRKLLVDEPSVRIVDYGIAGIGLIQDLMDGYDGLVIADAVDRGGPPGTLYWLRPRPEGLVLPPGFTAETHYLGPARVILLAAALRLLPAYVRILGCQPGTVDELGLGLTPPVARAVARAVPVLAGWARRWVADPAVPEPLFRPALPAEAGAGPGRRQTEAVADADR